MQKNLLRPLVNAVLLLSTFGLNSSVWASETFEQCVVGLQDTARNQGISPQTVDQVLAKVNYLDKVIELDRRQPEFTTPFSEYLGLRVTEQKVKKGRELYHQYRDLLQRVTRETGVPGHYLVAFWGLETNFGTYFGKMSTLDSLATLACDPRRSEYFTQELMSALKIIDSGDIEPERMQGSWAGALGHVQFMPSVFLKYARDADKDGTRDLWGSVPDAMLSAGTFLKGIGWKPQLRWGREVLLPKDFNYRLAGLGQTKSLAEWKELGLTDAFGRSLANVNIQASLLVPAGHAGPAFLVYDNFEVIMRWNRSEYYALAVGHLADRIAGAGPLQNTPPADSPRLSRVIVLQLQEKLIAYGVDPGTPDGILGPATRKALREYQHQEGLVADGYPDATTFARLGVSFPAVEQ
ncbi:lytic murein transglycosylase [Hahella sp. CCB-MM4]|uniref:lytic murein transglycosylase n=1 Tax=Hahella sp. (strain CCB-MM4) TaxID=1926491 RepID=UPI000B9AEB6D|nr:lytic murein transglycosylase [Hahella sp. CCB-MM4]